MLLLLLLLHAAGLAQLPTHRCSDRIAADILLLGLLLLLVLLLPLLLLLHAAVLAQLPTHRCSDRIAVAQLPTHRCSDRIAVAQLPIIC